MRISVICGVKDSGKTRAARTVVVRLQARGLRVGGVLSEGKLSEGIKTSYTFRDLSTGRQSLYARRRRGAIPPGELAYEFLAEGVLFGCNALRRAAAEGVDVLFIDEIGPLEAGGAGLWPACREILAAFPGRIVLTVRPALLEWLRGQSGIGREEVAVLSPAEAESISVFPGPKGSPTSLP
jgi:nucleoside-triphosphatase THEP1